MWPDFLLRGINFDSGQAQKKDALPDVFFGACGRIYPPGINFDSGQAQKKDAPPDVFFGACGRIRTGDLLITSELLCQLSHTSTVKYQMIV